LINLPPVTALPTVSPTPAALQAAVPGPEDAAKFEAAFSRPHVTIAPLDTSPAQPVPLPTATPPVLGERILASVERMRVGYHEGMTRMDASMHKDGMSSPEIMAVFIDAMRISIQQDMLSKLVGRTTQNMDTLLKGQWPASPPGCCSRPCSCCSRRARSTSTPA